MQIISGLFKGKNLATSDKNEFHPMGSREKLALFNMILPYLPNSSVLDAFAGSGALGLESLSRGAKSVVFLEKSPKIAKILKNNIKNLNLPSSVSTSVVVASAKNFTSVEEFDLIFADPPYDDFHPEEVENLLKFLKKSGILVLSSPKSVKIPDFSGLKLEKSRSYAAASISIYTKL